MESPYQQAGLTFLLGTLQDEQVTLTTKFTQLQDTLTGSLINWTAADKAELTAWLAKWKQEQAIPEPTPTKNRDWFAPQRWLTDAEIEWALPPTNYDQGKFKILPPWQFSYARQFHGQRTDKTQVHPAFTKLVKELKASAELVLIPVNNASAENGYRGTHWSLLVYETKSKVFHHWDTLTGTPNHALARSLISELSAPLNLPHLGHYHGEIQQPNGWDCGVAVIALAQRIMDHYSGELKALELGNFNFPQKRAALRKEYLDHGTS